MNSEEKLIKNWTDSSNNYSNIVKAELNSFKKQVWRDIILKKAGKTSAMDILDVGTGPGFFAIIMSQAGNRVTAIDCTEAMIQEAKANAENEGVRADFRVSDGQNLEFEDESFDLIISRNVTWTLLDAQKAYREWKRVLRPQGKILIFDANWNIRFFNEDYLRKFEEDQEDYRRVFGEEPPPYTDEMIDYRKSMPMCQRIRPQWDFNALVELGFKKIYYEMDIGRRVYDERQKIIHRSTPMFMLVVEK
ncbi:class I SAM-dependent methyltransferase [Desulfosporosinus meridiei]|uniref:Methylase involved in ubiquinone/menaquinone biosynthesis n=1 Tax=Desulfosporosinus meridiei (strain ATCC BAA-275 / DSM 13257 / KCTC 12902 / NCIMB 13706 / S10) TaxID=768704 RepID=J7ILB1_DESMD|nr:class I SAM-dependent methyltransferase [Desulfosporosinus meridiei]AFQ42587.1 methylase involved in ubiquinone/menaquinone biosynthesis [Desulfosporosinus meridiei DSM 13257]